MFQFYAKVGSPANQVFDLVLKADLSDEVTIAELNFKLTVL